MTLVEMMQAAAQGVVSQQDRVKLTRGVMTAGGGVRISDKLTLDAPLLTQTARERELRPGDRVLCIYENGDGIVLDREG